MRMQIARILLLLGGVLLAPALSRFLLRTSVPSIVFCVSWQEMSPPSTPPRPAPPERHHDQKNNLRMLPQPIYRYKDSTQQRDGALLAFVWTNGTDPERIVRIEATKTEHGVVWPYQPVRFTYRALRLQHEDKLVWEVSEFHERDRPLQTSPYVTGLMWQEGW